MHFINYFFFLIFLLFYFFIGKKKAADDFSLSISNIEVDKCENFKERF
jgi:hypothetical protein